MPDTTPGEVNYNAWRATLRHTVGYWSLAMHQPWGDLRPLEQHAWEAAAAAVLTWQAAQHPGTAGWLTAHPPPPLTDAARAALDATLEAFGEEETRDA